MVTDTKCTKCGEVKDINGFHNDKKKRNGKSSWCKVCHHKYSNARQKRTLSTLLENRKTDEKYLEYQRNYQKNLRLDKNYTRAQALRTRVRKYVIEGLVRPTWEQKVLDLIGCRDRESLLSFLEATAHANGYSDFTMDDLSKDATYQIDHRVPCSFFNLINSDGTDNEAEIRKCFHYSNMQILTTGDNIRKSNNCDFVPSKEN